MRDVWAQRDIGGRDGGIAATIPAHGAELYRVTPAKHSGTGVTAYEAESPANAAVDGAAPADCADCSGGKKIGNLYNGGALQFRNIRVSRGGTYQVGIRYVSGDLRSATVSANGQSPITLGFPSSGGWDLPATATVPLSLHAGNNTVEIDSSSAVYSPNVDALKVPASPR